MGAGQSTLDKHGYKKTEEKGNSVVATKGDETFLIKKLLLTSKKALSSEIEIFKNTSHPHIVSAKNSFREDDSYYVVMDFCQGGNVAEKLTKARLENEFEVLNWFVEICMALKIIHGHGLLYKHLKPEDVFLTEFGILCLGEFGHIHENSRLAKKTNHLKQLEAKHYQPPEFFTNGTYDAKSEIWSLGCLLYELCTGKPPFSADDPINLRPKITEGSLPALPKEFSPDLCELFQEMVKRDPQSRPPVMEILEYPCILRCLLKKCKNTVEELQGKLDKLRIVADNLEQVHQGTTIGSLTGGVIGAAGGITSIVGLGLAPFTLGFSLVVTGVGVGVSVAGGITAAVSNITDMVNQSSDRKAVRRIIAEMEQKISAVATWVSEISNSLQAIGGKYDTANAACSKGNMSNENAMARLGCTAGKGLGGIAELVRLVKAVRSSRFVAQTSKAIRVAEVATGVFAGLFLAVDVFFIAMDAKEIHHIRQANKALERRTTSTESESKNEPSDETEAEAQDQSSTEIRSEIMKCVLSIREAADKLQKVLNELKSMILTVDLVY